jgi:hypothetical protein
MTSDQTSSNPTNANAAKDPSEWVTGEEAMTGPRASFLQTLCQEAGEELDPTLAKAAASQKIDELQQRTGRGQGTST